MTARVRFPRARYTGLVVAVAFALCNSMVIARADEPPSWRDRLRRRLEPMLENQCLTPQVDRVFQQAADSGALRRALGNGFTLSSASAHDDRIDLVIEDAKHQRHGATLALQRITGRTPDGHAGRFVFYLRADATGRADASQVLLSLATVLARAIPDTALAPCGQRAQGFSTRVVALLGASVHVSIIATALAFGFWKLRDEGH